MTAAIYKSHAAANNNLLTEAKSKPITTAVPAVPNILSHKLVNTAAINKPQPATNDRTHTASNNHPLAEAKVKPVATAVNVVPNAFSLGLAFVCCR